MSVRPGVAAANGPAPSTPPRFTHPPNWPLTARIPYSAEVVPRRYRSTVPAPGEAAATSPSAAPPRFTHGPHRPPATERVYTDPLEPLTTTVTAPGPVAAAPGPASTVSPPPSPCQPVNVIAAFHEPYQSAPSPPR